MSSYPIDLRDVHHSYGKRHALQGVSLQMAPGEIVGLVGANGSGKTTLLKILAGFIRPQAGHVRVFDLSPSTQTPQVMQRVRFAFAPPALYGNLTAREHLQHLTRLHENEYPMAAVSDADIDTVLQRLGLASRGRDRVRTFSFGMRQRLVLAQALLPRPQLLVLDEPSDGLDPVAVTELRDLLLELRNEWGLSILLSSHLLEEIEQLVDRMLVLSEGRVLFAGAPLTLTARYERLVVQADPQDVALRLLRADGYAVIEKDGVLEVDHPDLSLERIQQIFEPEQVQLIAFHRNRPHLGAALLRTLEQSDRTSQSDVEPTGSSTGAST